MLKIRTKLEIGRSETLSAVQISHLLDIQRYQRGSATSLLI